MRQVTLLLFFAALILGFSCNNNNSAGGGGWSAADKRKGLNECLTEVKGRLDATTAKKLCDCALQKTMRKYDSYAAAENSTEEEGIAIAQSCMDAIQGGGGNDFDDEDDFGDFNNKKKKQDDFEDDNFDDDFGDDFSDQKGGARWTSQERRSFIQGCATARRQAAGVSAKEANDYCDCMTGKIERKYSFRDANRMTAQDFQTREWQSAITDCSGGGGGGLDDFDDDY